MTSDIELRLRGPGGERVDLWRTLISHGFHDLAPMAIDEAARSLDLTLRVPRGMPRRIRIAAAADGKGYSARVEILGRATTSAVTRDAIARGAARVLRLDQDLSPFYRLAEDDAELAWVTAGAGRMLRSPTVWEDVVKTLCTTNCSWSLTTTMVNALVRELGEPAVGFADDPLTNAFPTPVAMAGRDERFYRGSCDRDTGLRTSFTSRSWSRAARSISRCWPTRRAPTSPTRRSKRDSDRSPASGRTRRPT